MTVLFQSTHKPVFQTPVFCLFLYFHCLSTNGSGFHYILQTKHVPHTPSPELLSLVTMDSFCFHFLNTLCPALTQLSGSTQATMEKAMPLHIWFFSCVLFFWASTKSKHPLFGEQHLIRRNRQAVFPMRKRQSLPSTLYWLNVDLWEGRHRRKSTGTRERLQGSADGWDENKRDQWVFPYSRVTSTWFGWAHYIFHSCNHLFQESSTLNHY